MGATQDYPQSSCCSQGLRKEFKNSNFWALSLKNYYLLCISITSFYLCLDLLCVSVWQKRNDEDWGEQDDYLSQGHPMSRGHPSQQRQHDPFSSAIWLSWNKGSPKVLGSKLGVDFQLLLLGGFYWGNLLHWGFDPDTGDFRELLWIPLRGTQEHFHGFLCSEMLMEDFAAGLHWKMLLGKLCSQGRLITLSTTTFFL